MVKNYHSAYKKPHPSSQNLNDISSHDIDSKTSIRKEIVNSPLAPLQPPKRRQREAAQLGVERRIQKIQETQILRGEADKRERLAENQRRVKELKAKRKAEHDRYEKAAFWGLNPQERAIVGGAAAMGAVALSGGLLAPEIAGAFGTAELAADESLATPLLSEQFTTEEIAAMDFVPVDAEPVAVEIPAETPIEPPVQAPPEPIPEPVNPAPAEVNPAADAINVQGAVENSDIAELTNIEDINNIDNIISDAELQAEVDNILGAGQLDVANLGQLESEIASNPSLLARIGQAGAKGIRIISQLGTIAGLGIGAAELISDAKSIKNAQTTSEKIKKVADLVNKANQLHASATGQELEELENIGNNVEKIGDFIKEVEDGIENIQSLQEKEITVDKTHNEQLNKLINENRAETQAIKHQEKIIDKELQQVEEGLEEVEGEIKKLEDEEKQNININNRIASTLDRPTSPADFIKDLQGFIGEQAKIDYLTENYETFISFNQSDITKILRAVA